MRETLDTPRLLGLLAWAEGEEQKRQDGQPSEWDQTVYLLRYDGTTPGSRCGTTCCLAGKVVLEDDAPITWQGYGSTAAEHGYLALRLPDTSHDRVFEYAKGALGLTEAQATVLFEGSNTIGSLRALVAAITEGEQDFDRLIEIQREAQFREAWGDVVEVPAADSPDAPF